MLDMLLRFREYIQVSVKSVMNVLDCSGSDPVKLSSHVL